MSSPTRDDILALTEAMPTRHLVAGEVLFGQGEHDAQAAVDAVAVLVEGRLQVSLGGDVLSEITIPGAFVGEISALLGTVRSADVVATTDATVRLIGDPEAFFETNPALALELARQLAGRLQRLLAYVGDVKEQYAGADGHLGVLDSVLGKLASRPPVDIEPGSDRDGAYDG